MVKNNNVWIVKGNGLGCLLAHEERKKNETYRQLETTGQLGERRIDAAAEWSTENTSAAPTACGGGLRTVCDVGVMLPRCEEDIMRGHERTMRDESVRNYVQNRICKSKLGGQTCCF